MGCDLSELENIQVQLKVIHNDLKQYAFIPKRVYTTSEAKQVLGIGNNKWEQIKHNLVPSRIFGKWSAKSVHEEFEKIHGFKF